MGTKQVLESVLMTVSGEVQASPEKWGDVEQDAFCSTTLQRLKLYDE